MDGVEIEDQMGWKWGMEGELGGIGDGRRMGWEGNGMGGEWMMGWNGKGGRYRNGGWNGTVGMGWEIGDDNGKWDGNEGWE